MSEIYKPVPIPSNQAFLKQWHLWVQGRVNKHFKRDKERAIDTAQEVRLRLLAKDFIGRWFFKHLSDELVDKAQAEKMLGGRNVAFISALQPVVGERASKESLWSIKDILKFARFDHERYYYSIQNHTIDSARVLKLLGYGPEEYGALESLYRQGRLRPAELTEHICREQVATRGSGSGCSRPKCTNPHYSRGYCSTHYKHAKVQRCPDCDKGRQSLRERGISLTHRWTEPSVAEAVRKLRWNDSQLQPFLREWRSMNMIRTTPEYIMRRPVKKNGDAPGIDAGLLKYASIVITNEVVNSFKRMSRSDDLESMILNNGVSPELSNSETTAVESDDESSEGFVRVLRDASAHHRYAELEESMDIKRLVQLGGLSQDEMNILVEVDLEETPIGQFASNVGIPAPKVHRLRTNALKKLRSVEVSDEFIQAAAMKAAVANDCLVQDIFGPSMFGPQVKARTDLYAALNDAGMSARAIAGRLRIPFERVAAGLNRACLREMRSNTDLRASAE